MDTENALQIIENLITQESPEEAAAYAENHIQSLLNPTCGATLSKLLEEELNNQGVTRRYRALTSINAYTSAVVRRRLMSGLGGPLESVELPAIEVVSEADAGDLIDVDEESYEFKPNTFDSWLEVLTPSKAESEESAEGPLNDIAISNLQSSVDSRLLNASMQLRAAAANADAIVSQCQGIIHDCNRLLTEATPTYLTIDRPRVQSKMAEATRYMASALDAKGEPQAARPLYLKAMAQYAILGNKSAADRCKVDDAWMRFTHEGNIDGALEGINQVLATVPENTPDHGVLLFELAKLHSAAGDDFEAEKIALRVEQELGPIPSGADYADSLTKSLMAVFSGEANPSQTFTDTNQVRGIYRGLYFLLEKTLRNRGDIAGAMKYHRLLQDLDGNIQEGSKSNLEFSQRMSSQLEALFEQMDKYKKGDN